MSFVLSGKFFFFFKIFLYETLANPAIDQQEALKRDLIVSPRNMTLSPSSSSTLSHFWFPIDNFLKGFGGHSQTFD